MIPPSQLPFPFLKAASLSVWSWRQELIWRTHQYRDIEERLSGLPNEWLGRELLKMIRLTDRSVISFAIAAGLACALFANWVWELPPVIYLPTVAGFVPAYFFVLLVYGGQCDAVRKFACDLADRRGHWKE